MDSRDLIRPGAAVSLIFLYLPMTGYSRFIQGKVRELLGKLKSGVLPLHLPRAGMIQARWPNVADHLFHFRDFMDDFGLPLKVPCVC